ncbi:serine carboxypeptidase S28-domain-containing protein [Mycena rebaudengoi]|nr:serine carboxypeptidase S28-domain-containing protein [Mycena rebaudengoi]
MSVARPGLPCVLAFCSVLMPSGHLQWFRHPLDHFTSDSSNATFLQRYWVNMRHYKPGSVGVVLEHRYYRASIPVENFTTGNLRWLNDQAAADSANFMANVKFSGIEEDLTAPNTPWIYYGGSYAGARAAHIWILYPDLVYGFIASSGYYEIIRRAAPSSCSAQMEDAIRNIDGILSGGSHSRSLKMLFGLADLQHDDDFVSLISSPISSWQSKNWHPDFISTRFDDFCAALDKPVAGSGLLSLSELPYGSSERAITLDDGLVVDSARINYSDYIKTNTVARCKAGAEQCFGTYNDSIYQMTDISEDWRLWTFQYYTQTAPPDPRHPRIISKLLTLKYESKICRQAFPPGDHFTVPHLPNVTSVNVLGGFRIAADRLAIIDGEVDPWRPMTPHSDNSRPRNDRPFKLIPGAFCLFFVCGSPLRRMDLADEPPEIQKIHEEMIFFVAEWLKDWKPSSKKS